MSQQRNSSNIYETFIIGKQSESGCTALITNNLQSCSGNTDIYLATDLITLSSDTLIEGNISATTYYGEGFYLSNVFRQQSV